MDAEEQKDIVKIIDFLKDIKEIKIKDVNQKNMIFYENDDINSIEDYASLGTIKTLTQNPEYYLSKWNVIINTLINLDDYFFYLKKIEIHDNNEKTDKPKKKKEKKNESNSMNANTYTISSEITSGEINTSSTFKNSINKTIEDNNDIQENKINELKLNYIRKAMKYSNIEILDGKSFENYIKRMFHIMLLILKIDYYNFLHPKEVRYNNLLDISGISSKEIKTNNFEIDLLINGFETRDIKLLLDKYPKYFFFKEQLGNILNSPNQKFNFVSEICSNLIMKIEDKNYQVEKYINILKAFDTFRSDNLLSLMDEHKKIIIDSFLIDPYNDNIFVFITNGSYFLLKFAVNLVTTIFDQEKKIQIPLKDSQIKEIIEKEINSETIKKSPKIYNLIKNENNLCENLFLFFKVFSKLRINKIKHCLFYIGEEGGTNYEDCLLKFANIEQKELIYDDIYIIYQVKNLIKELYKLNDNFIKILKDFYMKIINNLFKEKEKVKQLCSSFKFSSEDLIKMKIIMNKEHEMVAKVIIEQNYFIYDIEYANNEEINNYMNKIEKIRYPMIMFINNSNKLYLNFLNLINKSDADKTKLYYFEPNKDFIDIMREIKSSLPMEFIKNIYSKINPKIPKSSFEKKGILDYNKLSSKIQKELDISIDENQIKEFTNLSLTKEEKEINFCDIKKNITSVDDLIGLINCKENIDNLKIKYDARMILLEENIKASAFYDYLYLSLIPELKFQEALKFYSQKDIN